MVNQYNPDRVSPPGGTVEDLMEERGLGCAEVAVALGFDVEGVEALVRGERLIDEGLAKKLHELFGVSVDFWMAREQGYRDWLGGSARLAG